MLSIVGISRGPALSNATDIHPAVAAARQSAVLGIPTVAACLASTSSQAPLEPAAEALGLLLEKLARVLQASRGWPRATNFPRAHFPFPTRGRWALGREVALPGGVSAGGASLKELAAADCWALGEESSWMGKLAGTLMHALLMLLMLCAVCCVLCAVYCDWHEQRAPCVTDKCRGAGGDCNVLLPCRRCISRSGQHH